MATIELLGLDRADHWRSLLEESGLGDVYHHPGYLAALAANGDGEPRLFYFRDAGCTALHVALWRPLSALPFAHPYADRFDAVSPYGYAGPVTDTPARAADVWRAWAETARANGLVAEFIRFHPLLLNHGAFADQLEVLAAGRTIWMDLTAPIETGISKSRWRDARWATRENVRVESAAHDRLPAFFEMYQATMRRKGAEAYYFFPWEYFTRLRDGLGSDFWLMRAHRGDRDCAYAICLRHRDRLHYHLSCSDEDLAQYRAVTQLLVETARLGRDVGLTSFHLGGGYRGEDSLFQFKSHFSPHRAPFFVGRARHDPEAIAQLARLAAAAGQAAVDPNFFPPYRSRR